MSPATSARAAAVRGRDGPTKRDSPLPRCAAVRPQLPRGEFLPPGGTQEPWPSPPQLAAYARIACQVQQLEMSQRGSGDSDECRHGRPSESPRKVYLQSTECCGHFTTSAHYGCREQFALFHSAGSMLYKAFLNSPANCHLLRSTAKRQSYLKRAGVRSLGLAQCSPQCATADGRADWRGATGAWQ